MKAKLHKRSGVQIVRVKLGFGEKIERRVLDRMRLSGEPCFAPVNTDLRMGEVRELNYTFSGLRSIKEVLASTIEQVAYETMLVQLAVAFVACHDHGLDPKRLLLDTRFVFADEDMSLHFAYLPLNKYEAKGQTSLKWFLEELSFARLDISGDEGARLRQSLERYVHETGSRVNADRYCVMLASLLNLALPKSVADYVHSIDPLLAVQVMDARSYRGGRMRSQGARNANEAGNDIRTVPWEGRSSQHAPSTGHAGPSPVRSVPKTATQPKAQPWNPGSQKPSFVRLEKRPAKNEQPDLGRKDSATCVHALHRIRTGKLYSLYDNKAMLIGRGSNCDIQLLGNDRLSRTHARICCDDSGVRLTDLGSANGTSVGSRELAKNETITFGYGTQFILAKEEFEVVAL